MRWKFALIVSVVLLLGCNSTETIQSVDRTKPPIPTITVTGKPIQVYQSSNCWFYNGKGSCVDYIAPNEQLKNTAPFPVPSQSKIDINFDYAPQKDSLGASYWIKGKQQPIEQDITNGKTIIIPKDKGIYFYSIHGKWSEGSSSFVFVVEVK